MAAVLGMMLLLLDFVYKIYVANNYLFVITMQLFFIVNYAFAFGVYGTRQGYRAVIGRNND
jgi:hypothetical protein